MRNHAFATCVIRNDSYLPGALVQAHALREQETPAELVCLVTPEVSHEGCRSLELVFDRVLAIRSIVCPESRDQGCQHGERIPRYLTDRVLHDPTNYGINTAVLVVRPSIAEFHDMVAAISSATGAASHLRQYRWPDMQFLTAYWSGRWHNIDACFAPSPGASNTRPSRGGFAGFPTSAVGTSSISSS